MLLAGGAVGVGSTPSRKMGSETVKVAPYVHRLGACGPCGPQQDTVVARCYAHGDLDTRPIPVYGTA